MSRRLSREQVESLIPKYISYEKETGIFRWIKNRTNGGEIGSIAGKNGDNGYIDIKLFSFHFMAHRIAWILSNGEIQNGLFIDHINGIRSDNRLCNLRLVTPRGNAQNIPKNRSGGMAGATYHKSSKKWQSRITVNRKQIQLGYFGTEKEAHEAYAEFLAKLEKERKK